MTGWKEILTALNADDTTEKGLDSAAWIQNLAIRAEILMIQAASPPARIATPEIQSILTEILEKLRADLPPDIAVNLHRRAARWADRNGLWDFALTLYALTIDLSRTSDDISGMVEAMEELGEIHRRKGAFETAGEWQNRALGIAEEHHLYAYQAHAHNNLGAINVETGDLDAAETRFNQALELLENEPHPVLDTHINNNLGVVHCIRGNPETAYSRLIIALAGREQTGDRKGYAETAHNLAMALMDLERYTESETYIDNALTTSRSLGESALTANILVSRAELMLNISLYEIAGNCAEEALEYLKTLGDPLGLADAMRIAGAAARHMKQNNIAREMLECALTLAETHHFTQGIAQTCSELGELFKAESHSKKSSQFFEIARKAYLELGNTVAANRAQDRMDALNKPSKN